MIAVHLEAGSISVADREKPERPPGFALIRVLLAGICNTDLELQRGYYGFSGTPGHEFIGEVVEADSLSLVGKRVAGEINIACGTCEYCAIGLGRHCERRTVLGILGHPGAFAEYLTLPEANLHPVPDGLENEQAVFLEPLAAACEILDQVNIKRKEPVAVLGDGKLGLLIAQVLQAHGARVTLYGRHTEKLRIAEQAGIETSTAVERSPRRFPFVVDSTGSRKGLQEAVRLVRPRGTVIMKSTMHGEVGVDTALAIVNEVTLVGSRCGRFEPALELLKSGAVNVRSLLSNEFRLDQAAAAFAEASKRGVMKVLLRA